MPKFLLTTFFIILAHFSFAQENLYEVQLNEKIDSSTVIVFGKVVNTFSHWDSSGEMIYTTNSIEIFSIYKGQVHSDTILVETVGGRVGNTMITTSALLELEVNDLGVFFLTQKSNGSYDVYSSKQGFLKPDYAGQKLICPFYSESLHSTISIIKSHSGMKEKVVKPFPISVGSPKSSTSGVCISPGTISAGTNSVLSISGSGFGTSGPSASNKVLFPSADDGGSPVYFEAPLWTYQLWSDTLIELIVPTEAGTGNVRVEVSGSTYQSDSILTIPYSISNNGNGNIRRMIGQNATNGQTWTFGNNMNSSMPNGIGDIPFEKALDTWKCATGVNWTVASTSVPLTDANANDGINLVALNMFLPNGVLGVCYTYSNTCNGTDWYITGQDILFDFFTIWYVYSSPPPAPNTVDLESVALHELGHAHVLAHVVDTYDAMHYATGPGIMRRTLNASNIIAGNYVMNLSENQPVCSQTAVTEVFPTGCSEPSLTDIGIINITEIPDDSTCFGLLPVHLSFGNWGIDTVSQIEWKVRINGNVAATSTWIGTLASNEEVFDYYIGDFDFQDSSYFLEIWAETVDGTSEIDHSNDSISFDFHPTSCSPDDASVRIMSSLDSTVCLYSADILGTLINPGENILNSCRIYVEANGVLVDSTDWTGSILPGDSVQNIVVSNYTFSQDENVFVIWSGLPNGVSDTYPANDTSSIYYFNKLPMQGTYTIGGVSPDIPTISEAFYRLNQYGICGDVTLNIRDGIYLERLQLDSIASSSPNYHVTIQSESLDANLVSIKNTDVLPQEPGLSLSNTDNVTIRHIRFVTNDPMPQIQTSIEVKNGSKNINITDNLFILDTIAPNYVAPCIDLEPLNQQSQALQNISIARNRFENYRRCIEGTTSSFNTGYAEGLFIQENEFIGHRNEVVDLEHFGKIYITENHSISNSEFGPPYSGGIHVEQWVDTVVISGNYIVDSVASTALKVQYFQGAPASSVLRVFNNSIIHTRNNGGNSPRPTVVISGAPNFDFNHNTVYSYYPSTYLYDDPVLELSQPSPISGNVMNNIIVGKGDVNQVINSTIPYNSVNNVLWHDGGTYPIEPDFASPLYLVPMNSFELDNMGTPVSYISTDIEGSQRSMTTPDVGAYEFHPFDYDIEIDQTLLFEDTLICPNDSVEMIFKITNNGLQQIDSFYVYWAVANGAYDTALIYQTILPQQSEVINLGYQTFPNAYTTIDVTCDLPSGLFDSLQYNNSHTFVFYTKLFGSYTVGDSSADIPTMEDVMIALDKGLCGPVVFNLFDGTYNPLGTLDFVPNSSSVNTVTFQSLAQDTGAVYIVGLPSEGVMRVLGMKYVNFKNITFQEYVVLDSVGVVTFDSCRFISSGFVHGNQFSWPTSDIVDSVFIMNSHLIDSDILFDYTPVHVTNVGLISNLIEGDSEIIFDAFNNSTNHSNILITENVMDVSGPYLNAAAIFVDAYTNVEISRNSITCSGANAIEFRKSDQNSIIKNNMIKSVNGGLLRLITPHPKVISNSFSGGFIFYNGNEFVFKNNIFQKTGTPSYWFLGGSITTSLFFDNNLYYGSDFSVFHYQGSGANISTSYNTWKGGNGKDANSLVGAPGFISASDLHVNSSIADSSGAPLPEVLVDFDGEPRNPLFPDIGADEFDMDLTTIFDISVDEINHPSMDSCFVEDSIIFTLANNYSDTLFNAQIELSLDGNLTTYPWSGVLAPGQNELVFLTTAAFTPSVLSAITVTVMEPNGLTDYYPDNNTLNLSYLPYKGVYIDDVCNGDTILAAISTDPTTQYLWNSGETTSTISIDSVTLNWVQGINSAGCISFDTITVTDVFVPAPISIYASDTIFCPGDMITIGVTPVIPGSSYSWSNFSLDVHAYNTSSPTFVSLWVTDSIGCKAYYSFQPIWDTLPDASFNVNLDTLFAATIDPDYTYTWYFNGQPIVGANDTFYVMTQNGTYSLLVEDLSCSEFSTGYNFNFNELSVPSGVFILPEIYPNPVARTLWIENVEEEFSFQIFDSQGRIVSERGGVKIPSIDLTGISSGSYILSIQTHNGEFHFRFVKALE